MTTESTSFVSGSGVGIVSAGVMVLLERAPDEVVDELLDHLDDGVDAVLEVLAGVGLRALGSFAIAITEGDAVRVVARGSARVVINSGGANVIDGAGLRTWNEEVVPSWERLVLSLGDAAADVSGRYELDRGVVPAAVLVRPAVARSAEAPVAVDESEQEAELPSAPADVASVEPDAADVDSAPEPAPPEAESTSAPAEPAPAPRPDGHEPAPSDAVDDQSAATAYDEMYGHTVHRRVQEAAIHHDDDPADPALDTPGAPGGGVAEPVLGDHDGHTISLAELRALQQAEAAGATLAPGVQLGNHDGFTISRDQLSELSSNPAEPPATSTVSAGVTVQALVCTNGHPNPTHLTACRQCGQGLAGEPATVARPPLGRLTLSTGEVVELDRSVLLGRNPKIEGRLVGELPKVVRLEGFQGVSRTHAIVRLEGWQVLVVDLGSANHTTVTLPGRPPRRLHADEPILLADGATVDLGGEVTVTYAADA